MDAGFNNDTIRAMQKAQLNKVSQNPNERVCEYKIRIDGLYKSAYGGEVAVSNYDEVIYLRNAKKKEVLMKGMRMNIRKLLWSRLESNDTYEAAVIKAQECESLIELKNETENVEKRSVVSNTNSELNQILQAINNVQLSAATLGAETVALIGSEQQEPQDKRVTFRIDNRNREVYPYKTDRPDRARSASPQQRAQREREQRDSGSPFRSNRRDEEYLQRRASDPVAADQNRSRSPYADEGGRNNRGGYRQDSRDRSDNSTNRTNNSSSYPGRDGNDRQQADGNRRQVQSSRYERNQTDAGQAQREDRTCFFCKNKGHIKRACRKYQKWKETNGPRNNGPQRQTERQ